MIMYPFLHAFQSSNLLLPKTKIEMGIDLNDPNFYFIGQTVQARLDEDFRIFHLKEVKLDSSVALHLRKQLKKEYLPCTCTSRQKYVKRHHLIPLTICLEVKYLVPWLWSASQ